MYWLIHNPEIKRNIRSRLRRGKILGGVILYLILLLLIAYIMYQFSYRTANIEARQEYMKNLYFVILGLQFFVSLVMGAVICSSSIVSEREKKSYDFLRMLPIHPIWLTIGKLIGVPILVYLLLFLTLPISLICVLMGGVSGEVFLITYTVLLFCGLFAHSLGLFFSSLAPKSSWSNSGTLLVLFSLNLLTSLPQLNFLNPLRYFGLAKSGSEHLAQVSFYWFEVSEMGLAICVYAFFTCWFLIGINRNIVLQENRLLSKGQSLLFFASVNLLVTGLFWPYLNGLHEDFWLFMTLFLAISLCMIMTLIFIIVPNYDELIRWFHEQKLTKTTFFFRPLAENRSIFPVVLMMNLILSLIIAAIFLTTARSQQSSMLLCLAFFILFSLTYALLIQLLHTWWSPFNRNYVALGVLILSFIIPVFGGEPEFFLILNPVFIFGTVLENKHLTSLTIWSLLILIILCTILLLWYQGRLKHIQNKIH